MTVYLSGGIEYAQNFGKDWRKNLSHWIKKNLNHSIFDPTKESIIFLNQLFPNFKRSNLKNLPINEIRNIISNLIIFEIDTIINKIDYLICYWDESCTKGAGTQGELTVARFYNKPVYIVTKVSKENLPSWIIGCSTEIVNDFSELKKILLTKFTS